MHISGFTRRIALVLLLVLTAGASFAEPTPFDPNAPLGFWPDFTPIGFITAPHPDDPEVQTHLYGDWGGIVGEEFLTIQDGRLKLFYHSYHETYLTMHLLEEDILHDWLLGYDPVTKIKLTPLARPGGPNPGPAWSHTDTPAYLHHPLTGEHLLYNTVRPGTIDEHPEWDGLPGYESAIQVATSTTTPVMGLPFQQSYENTLVAELWWEQGWNQDGVIKGGLSEPTAVWAPHLGEHGKVRLFYRGLHGAPGSYWNWRISYADSDDGKTGWVKNPTPVFDPSDPANPAYQWTQPPPVGFGFRGSWQAHCTGDTIADGVHMVMTVSNQNYAGYGHLAYYWSPDWGDTWYGHPDNPIITPGTHPDGVPATGFQRTPTLVVDEEHHRYILAYNAGWDIEEAWRRRTHLAVADRPDVTTAVAAESGVAFRVETVAPNPTAGVTRIRFQLPVAGRLEAAVFALDGRRVATLPAGERAAGAQVLTWDRTAHGSPAPSGTYLVRGVLTTAAPGPAVATGRITILR